MEIVDLFKRAKDLIRLYGFIPKKRLGQNFTINSEILDQLISYASLTKNDVVLEVGAGFGFLTQLLSSKCKKVIALEIDPQLVYFLSKQFSHLQNIELIQGDILKVAIPDFNKVVSTPPYSISSPLLFRLLKSSFDSAVLILQKEFAERLAASVGSKNYGRLTVTVHYWADVELLDCVSRDMFYPPPDVDSMILRLKPRAPPFHVNDEETFFEIVRTLFTQRNKKVRNAVIPFLYKNKIEKKEAIKLADSLIYSSK